MTGGRRFLAPAVAAILFAAAGAGWAGEEPAPATAPAPETAAPAPPPPAPDVTARENLTGRIIAEVKIEGLETVPARKVLEAMATRVGLAFRPDTYADDYRRIMALGLFYNVFLLPAEPLGAGVRIRVQCLELPLIAAVVLRGNAKVKTGALLDRAVRDKTALLVGSRYDPHAAFKMARSFQNLYAERRYALARIDEPVLEKDPAKPGHVTVVFNISEDSPVDVRQVEFRGRAALPEKKLISAIETRPPGWFRPAKPYDRDVLRLDASKIQRLYHDSGYSDARVEVGQPSFAEPAGWRHRRAAAVAFEITEGPLYKFGPLTFSGLTLAGEAEARQRAGITPGQPFSDEGLHAAIKNLEALLGEHGRPFADVRTRRVATAVSGVQGVEFQVHEGPEAVVGEIRPRGNMRTQTRLILREMEILPGDLYDSRQLARSEDNLRRTRLFKSAVIRRVPGEEPETADLEVEVEETETAMFRIGAAVNPDNGAIGGSVSITERNFDWRNVPRNWDDLIYGSGFRGGGQVVSAEVDASALSRNARLSFYNPWIWDTPAHYSFGFSLFRSENQFTDFDVAYTGASVNLGRRLFIPELRAGVQYTIQQVTMSHISDDEPIDFRRDEGTNLYSSGRFRLVYDSRDDWMVTSKGWLCEASEEVFGGPFGGDRDFYKTRLEGNNFLTFLRTWNYPHVLHLRAEADWANPYGRDQYVPVSERYYAGGIGTIRGFDYRTISPRVDDKVVGGDFRLVENAEYIFPLYRNDLRGVVFFDAGDVWAQAGDFDLHDQRRAVGAGLHIKTPPFLGQGAPIKLYFSEALNPRPEETKRLFQMSFSFLF